MRRDETSQAAVPDGVTIWFARERATDWRQALRQPASQPDEDCPGCGWSHAECCCWPQ
jgi:hypothetical protein